MRNHAQCGRSERQKYLFVDDRWICRTYALHRLAQPFEKHPANPVILPEPPWENGLNCYGTVALDENKYRAWFQVFNRTPGVAPQFRTAVGYAESADGISWIRPRCGLHYPGHGVSPILLASSGRSDLCSPAVIKAENSGHPDERYRMLFFDAMYEEDLTTIGAPWPPSARVPGWTPVEGEGLFIATSADGCSWRRHPVPKIAGPNDASSLTLGDDGRFLATFKTSVRPDRHFRIIAATLSEDGWEWDAPIIILEPDLRDPPGTEFYGMSAFRYFGNWLGLLWVYHNSSDDKSLDLQLAIASQPNDPLSPWRRAADRRTVLARGQRGTWDGGRVYAASGPIVAPPHDPDALWLYYGGASGRHVDSGYQFRAIGLARLRVDGFACLAAGDIIGELTTVPIRPPNRTLLANISARGGFFWVEARVPGTDKCLWTSDRIGNACGTRIVMTNKADSPFSTGEQITLVFYLCRAQLFSFWFE